MRSCKSDTLPICWSRRKFLTRRRSEERAYLRKSKPYCRKIPSSKRSISISSVDRTCCVANTVISQKKAQNRQNIFVILCLFVAFLLHLNNHTLRSDSSCSLSAGFVM